ncbi:tetratricopeptide repeat protein [Sulfurospirillum arcachonense]|uniref:tetratricopeptide repeat protein n=1 Tax=Sulfurospirillum arcachonense TaxID=57666 RepID=UPI0004682A75|nr:tetratricopeptide repeat protein [Sulfurospirillum arcachonense]
MKKISIIWLIAINSLLASEPSAYGAGNLDSANPYGLTSSEKYILKNKEKVKNLAQGVGSVKIQLSQINENYEGLRSVIESFGSKISKIDQRLRNLDENDKSMGDSFATLQQEVTDLKEYVNESRQLQDTNQEKIKLVLGELSSLIDSINNNYVSKESFLALENRVKNIESKMEQKASIKKVAAVSKKSGAELLKEGMSFFKKKSYNESKIRFTKLLEKGYKPARSNYFLGEIAYFQNSYKTAIKHYKKSISLYDKADYIPTLLYHTGISFSKLKENNQAKQFFDALKQGYPNSKEAKSLN